MENTIVFLLKVDNEESYGNIAHFIYKRENKEIILPQDVIKVEYKYYLNHEGMSYKNWAKIILSDREKFRNIEEPHNIKNITEQFRILYCISVKKDADIVNLGNLYLLKKYYTNISSIVIFPDCDKAIYHKVSQFLYSISKEDEKFYDECFFELNKNVQRAQVNEIEFSRFFTPLQIINKNNVEKMFQRCNKKNWEKDELLGGAIKLLKDRTSNKGKTFIEEYHHILQQLDVMAVILVCYGIGQTKMKIDTSLVEKYAYQMQQYSNAIHQLAENIIYHSKTQMGIVAMRVHKQGASYIAEEYRVDNTSNNFLEIIISDFCADNLHGNMVKSRSSN